VVSSARLGRDPISPTGLIADPEGQSDPAVNDGVIGPWPHRLARFGSGSHGRSASAQPSTGSRSTYPELDVQFDGERGIYWQYLVPTRPCFTFGLLRDMRRAIDRIVEIGHESTARNEPLPIRYVVTASRIPTIFNLGGDLLTFVGFIRRHDLDGLRRYAHACIAVQYPRGTNMGLPLVSIALVQGDALGGGFEAALAGDIIIAERRAKFGFPEVLFGLFPGMGAYSFLARRIGPMKAEEMIMSGRLYEAAELADLGIVDVMVEDGMGEQAVLDFIKKEERRTLARRALYQIRRRVNPVSESELLDITNLWADTAARLPEVQLKIMERLARAQERRWATLGLSSDQAGAG
jgi:DSF synthase